MTHVIASAECANYNAPAVHLAYVALGTAASAALLRRHGGRTVREAYDWPAVVTRSSMDDALCFALSCVGVYNAYTRYHMGALISLLLPCHLSVLVCAVMLSPLANTDPVRDFFTALHMPFAGGALCGALFRDRDTWSSWTPPLYGEMFYIQHALVFLIPHYLYFWKLGWSGTKHAVRLTACASIPAWALMHFAFYHPVSLATSANLEYMLCPIKGVQSAEAAGSWPLPRAAWPLLYGAGPPFAGAFFWYLLELPLLQWVFWCWSRVQAAAGIRLGLGGAKRRSSDAVSPGRPRSLGPPAGV
eukprot:TRINITY_DN28933_c0_g1_i2.p1 TRINITY_DN28933_c0_g1~~TRINITY_DN28933_c0_g1_i2.p1  ORF type:complete len:329 (+),score=98.82 TRINITY_DN28933_c0_g1_i2:83-988(+)